MKDFTWRFVPVIVWATFLFVLSSIPDLSFPVQIFSWDDKIHHAVAYMPLGLLLLRGIVGRKESRPRDLWLAIAIGSLYGMLDEVHQYFVPGRHMDWTDALADVVGVVLGSLIFYKWRTF